MGKFWQSLATFESEWKAVAEPEIL